MGLFDRKSKRRTGKGSPSKGDPKGEAPKLGPVSTVLSESRGEGKEGSSEDIVQRRFGPGQKKEGADEMAKNLPPARRSEQPAATMSPKTPEPIVPLEVTEHSENESPELEVDPMAHIGRSTTITGDVVAEEDLEILGTVEGTVMLMNHRVCVGDGGLVKGQVHSGSVEVKGRIEGDVEATEVIEVCAGGYVGGNVKSPRVILHDGAIVIGGLDMSAALNGAHDKSAKRPVEMVKETPVTQPKEPQKIHTSAEPTQPTLKRVEVLPPEKVNRR
jgi:cytoskeletal protein CcmA (bactofilin family)